MIGTMKDLLYVGGANQALNEGIQDIATCLQSALQMTETFCELTPTVERVKLAGVESSLEEALSKTADTLRKVANLKGQRCPEADRLEEFVAAHVAARHESYREVMK